MADIQRDIDQIATARYGREVRGSIVKALTLMNKESSEAIERAGTAQNSAEASASAAAESSAKAKSYADRLVNFGGGNTDQVLTKKSNADYDYEWRDNQGGNDLSAIRSYVGMIIHSTTLDTEAKVKDIYGGTTWTKLEGVMLLGASASYAVNSTGGSATNKLTVANLPSHSHGLNDHTHSFEHTHKTNATGMHSHSIYWRQAQNYDGNHNRWYMCPVPDTISTSGVDESGEHSHTTNSQSATTTGRSSGNTTSTGSGTAINNMPPYKTVYIWERTA